MYSIYPLYPLYDIPNILLFFKIIVANFKIVSHFYPSFRPIFSLRIFIINSYRTFSTTNKIQSTDKLSFRFHATVDEISTKQRIYRNISQPRFYHARNTGTIGIQRRLVDWICRGRRYKRLVSGTLPSTRHANAVSNERWKMRVWLGDSARADFAPQRLHSRGIDLTSYLVRDASSPRPPTLFIYTGDR